MKKQHTHNNFKKRIALAMAISLSATSPYVLSNFDNSSIPHGGGI